MCIYFDMLKGGGALVDDLNEIILIMDPCNKEWI